MDSNLDQRLSQLEEKVEAIYKSVEWTRKVIKWTVIMSIVGGVLFVVLPLIGLVFVIPKFMNTLNDSYGALNGGLGY